MKTSIILMIITIISKVFGLMRETALAHFFGAGATADIFLIAFQIPMTFTNVMSGAIANGYIPIFGHIKSQQGEDKAHRFTSNLTNILCILSILLSVLGIIFAKPIVKLMAEGFEGEILNSAVFFSRLTMLCLFATATASVFKSYLQIYSKFIVSVIHAIILNVLAIIFMALSHNKSLNLLAIGTSVAFVLQYIVFIPAVRKTGYRQRAILDFKDPDLKRMIRVILPIFVSTSVIELNFMISRSIASGLFSGAISTLNYAYKLQSFVTGIVVTSIITVSYPAMAKYASRRETQKLNQSASSALSNMALLVIPSALGLLVLSRPIVEILFLRGAFSQEDAIVTASVLSFYALGVIGIGVREILSRVFYSLDDTKTPVLNSIVMVAINVVLSISLSRIMGIRGLALATSISFIAGALLLSVSTIKRHINPFKNCGKNILKITISSILMALVTKFTFSHLLKLGNLKALLLSIIISGLFYGILLIIFKEDEIVKLMKKAREKIF